MNTTLQKLKRNFTERVACKVSMKNFKNTGNSYEYGTIFIPVQNQKLDSAEMFEFLNQVAKKVMF